MSLHQQTNAHINNLRASIAHNTAITNSSRERSDFSVSSFSSLSLSCLICTNAKDTHKTSKAKIDYFMHPSSSSLLRFFPANISPNDISTLFSPLVFSKMNLSNCSPLYVVRLSISVLTRLEQRKRGRQKERFVNKVCGT